MLFQIIFVLLALFMLSTALMVVTAKNVVHAALWLIASFAGVSALYLLLQAEFLAIVQVLVYVGAISILILFAIMLTRHVTGRGQVLLYQRWWVGLIIAALLFGAILVPTVITHPWAPDQPALLEEPMPAPPPQPESVATVVDLGRSLVEEYLLPFEIAGIILLIGLIGAIVIAFEERSQRQSVPTLAEEVAQRRQQSKGKENG